MGDRFSPGFKKKQIMADFHMFQICDPFRADYSPADSINHFETVYYSARIGLATRSEQITRPADSINRFETTPPGSDLRPVPNGLNVLAIK